MDLDVTAALRSAVTRLVVAVVAYAAACVVFLWVRDEALIVGVATAFVIGLLATRVARRAGEPDLGPARWTLVAVLSGSAVLVLLVGAAGVDGAVFFGLALGYLAIAVALQELREEPSAAWWVWLLVAAVGVTAVSVVGVALGWIPLVWVAGVAGIVGVPIGLSLTSEWATRELDRRDDADRAAGRAPWTWPAVAAAGLVLLAGALAGMAIGGLAGVYVWTAGIAAVALMVGLVARTSGDVFVVIVVVALVIAIDQRTEPLPDRLVAGPGDAAVVALGDSYISGEGADVYFEGTNVADGDQCRRAPSAWPVLLARGGGPADRLLFPACSGAEIDDVLGEGDDTQLAEVTAALAAGVEAEAVLVSAGGNDAGFSSLGVACLLPVDCTELEAAVADHVERVVRSRLDAAYRRLRDAVPDDVVVAAVPYPVPLAPDTCAWSPLLGAEHAFLVRFTDGLNATIVEAAADAGIEVVDTVPMAFEAAELRICDREPGQVGVNLVAANSVLGTLEQSANPANWLHNSLHPNAVGHLELAGAVRAWWEGRAPGSATPGEADPVPPADGGRAGDDDAPCLGADDLQGCISDWMVRGTARALLGVSWVVLPALAGAWLLALALVRAWRVVYSPGSPSHDDTSRTHSA